MTTDFSCNYHPTRSTVDKCENCSSYLCLECKKIFRENRPLNKSGIFDNRFQKSDQYTPKMVLCPLCYYEAKEKVRSKTRRINVIFPLIFLSLFIGGFIFIMAFLIIFIGDSRNFSVIFWVFVPMFLILPIIFVGIFLLPVIRSRPKRSRYYRKERDAFLQSLDLTQSLKKAIYENSELFCGACGAIIEFNERYCPKCGSATQ